MFECKENKVLAEKAMRSVTNLAACYCESMSERITKGDNLNSEMFFEMSNTVSAMSKMLAVLCKMVEKSERADTDDQSPLPCIGESRRKDKGVRGMKLMYEPGDNLGWIRREPFERVMRLMIAWARAYHSARAEVTGKETFEEAEVTIEALACTLLPKKKCRVAMDYDPAGEKVYFDVVDEPEAVSEQEDGSPK